jgi:hypothetical protein
VAEPEETALRAHVWRDEHFRFNAEIASRTSHALIAVAFALLAHGANGQGVVIGDAREMHLGAVVLARLISGRTHAVTIRKRHALWIGRTNRQIVFAKPTHAKRALNAGVAVVRAIAARRTTIRHLVHIAAHRAFLARKAIGQVEVRIHAIGELLPALIWTHRHVRRTRIDAIEQVDAIRVEHAGLNFVQTNAVESARLAGVTIHRGITRASSGARAIETRHARRTNIAAHAAIGFVRSHVDAFRSALGQTSAARIAAHSIRANFARGTSNSAHAAIARIELRVDAKAIALRRAARTLRVTRSIRTNLTHRTNNAASAAVTGVDLRIDTRIGAFRRSTGTIEVALAAGTHLARSTNRAARAAIQTIVGHIDARRAAFRRSTNARQAAHAVRAHFALTANRAACAAVGDIRLQIDAQIAAFRRLSDAIERAFPGRADFTRSTCRSAHAAVEWVDLNVDTFAVALRGSTDAGEATRSIGTNVAVHAFNATHAAIVRIERRNGARAVAIGLSRRTCRTSARASAPTHAAHACRSARTRSAARTSCSAGSAAFAAFAACASRTTRRGRCGNRITATNGAHRAHCDRKSCDPARPSSALRLHLPCHIDLCLPGPMASFIEGDRFPNPSKTLLLAMREFSSLVMIRSKQEIDRQSRGKARRTTKIPFARRR